MIRPFELLDLGTLHRYRKQGVFLDSQSVLTNGPLVVPLRAVFSPISEAVGVVTGVYEKNNRIRLIGQAAHMMGEANAHMTFLTPEKRITPEMSAGLIEYLLERLGEREVQNLVAEADEDSNAFETLRQLNFSIYARQRIWRVTDTPDAPAEATWRVFTSMDGINARRLHFATVPSLVQQLEASDFDTLRGWVCYRGDDMIGFADVSEGTRGTWVKPHVHPEMEEVGQQIASLISVLRPRSRRPVYICIRSYQAGLGFFLEKQGAEPAASQAVMARRLAARVLKPEMAPLRTMNGTTEVTSPTQSSQSSVDSGQ